MSCQSHSLGMNRGLLSAALWYAKNGIPVFPCRPRGKDPLTLHGFKDATTDLSRVESWWRRWPSANIGMPTGIASGFLAVDVDPRSGGDVTLKELIEAHGLLPDTAEQITGGGGRHFLFRFPGIPVRKQLAPGIDLKGDGGYIIVTPSVHASGIEYKWHGVNGPERLFSPAEPPTWMLERIAKGPDDCLPEAEAAERKWRPGERNNRLTSFAGAMRCRGAYRETIEAALLEENRRRCEPPIPDDEVRGIAASVAAYDPPTDAAGENSHVRLQEWPDLVPLVNIKPDAIPANCLPSWLGDMAHEVAEATETPLEVAGLLAIAIVSASIAGKIEVSPEPDYIEPTNVYVCPAMESGSRKSAVLNRLLAPLIEWERIETCRIESERRRLLNERHIMETRIKRKREKAASLEDPSALIQQIRELEANLPKVPILPRLFVDDITPERLASVMQEQGERLALLSDEGGIFDILAGRYSKGLPNLDLWLKAHSGTPVRVDRQDPSRPPILLNRPLLTVAISPQPDVLVALKDKPGFRGRGLLARFLYALPQSRVGFRTLRPKPVSADVEAFYRSALRSLIDLRTEIAIQLQLSPSGYREWKNFQLDIERQFREGGKLELLRDWGGKLAGAAARVAGVFHMVDQYDRCRSVESLIAGTTVKGAVELAACLISHTRAVFDLMDRDSDFQHAERLLSWIERQDKGRFTIRECFRAHQARFRRVDGMIPAIKILEQHGYVRRVAQRSTGGRNASDVCEVNPALIHKV